MDEKSEEIKDVAVYNKEAILSSKKYAEKRDIISVLLKDNVNYTLEEVDTIIEDFMTKGVD
ncbi:hypothetical protein [Sneathia sanguinegens]|uniref:hypothetical protein n=1 Tax=Sneathia sanguinegens TaxID=40543 RepID=UPI00258261EA|nr:hypothetical protein [Sneathia sanguinegens]MDU4652607.1 hypothetical protein [Sneathia sanguinegens]